MVDPKAPRGENFPELVAIMQRLLAPDGCPWDREQTLQSLRPYVIEEAYEVVEAIDAGDPRGLCDELGDLLLQVVFQAEIARSKGWFGPNDVVAAISDKMTRRHPWVFGDERMDSAEGTVERWEAIKAQEQLARAKEGAEASGETRPKGALDGVPRALPALLRAARVGEKASAVGYDWPDAAGARAKVDEELAELDEALASGDRAAMERELGDVLFALASLARKASLDPEAALRGTLDRFSARFTFAEAQAHREGRGLRERDPAELDALWQQAKERLR
ncbi:MAG: nucleoside triphosphate pyrophosphohydrolase [Sandaracinaceae bacterium]|nr:nucleoside triphosphate pyrophosphohydrolase [Sandaracinaceae bacterium]